MSGFPVPGSVNSPTTFWRIINRQAAPPAVARVRWKFVWGFRNR